MAISNTLWKTIEDHSFSAHNPGCKIHGLKGRRRYVLGYSAVKQYDVVAIKHALENSGIEASFLGNEFSILHFDLMKFAFYHRLKERYLDDLPHEAHSFVFHNGVFVCWGLVREQLAEADIRSTVEKAHSPIVDLLDCFSDRVWPRSWRRVDVLPYFHIANLSNKASFSSSRVKNDCFYLKSGSAYELLAASLAFASSCRLHVYESAVDDAIIKFNRLPSQIAANKFDKRFIYGSSQVRKIRQWVGEIYAITLVVNVAEDFLDVPEYFWDDDTYQPFWRHVYKYFELDSRLKILNLRLKCLKDVLKTIARRRVSAQNHYLSFCVIVLLVLNLVLMIIEEYIHSCKTKR